MSALKGLTDFHNSQQPLKYAKSKETQQCSHQTQYPRADVFQPLGLGLVLAMGCLLLAHSKQCPLAQDTKTLY